MSFVRLLSRLLLLAAAAALFIGLTSLYAATIRTPWYIPNRIVTGRRPPGPQPFGVPKFAGEVFLIALVAVGGRKMLRLRLAD